VKRDRVQFSIDMVIFFKKIGYVVFFNNNSGLTPEQRISGLTSNFELSTAQ